MRSALALIPIVLLTAIPAAAQPGAPDPSFGSDGVVVHRASALVDLQDVAARADGSVVAVGFVAEGEALHGLVLRLLADGAPDPAFGQSGALVVRPAGTGTPSLVLNAVTADAEGRLVAAGGESRQDADRAVVVRLVDGALDPAFGTGGVSRALPTGTFVGQVLALPDGRLVVAGIRNTPAFGCFAARLTAAGALDPSFGSGGVTSFNAPEGMFNETCDGAALLPDGRLAVGGTAIRSGDGSAALLFVLTAGGALDPSFDGDGIATIPLCTGSCIQSGSGGFAVDPAGRFIFAGTLSLDTAPGWGSYVARVLPNGAADADLGTGGVVRDALRARAFGSPSTVEDFVLQPDGKLVLVGGAEGSGFETDLLVARLLADGTPDPAFGSAGEALVDARGNDLGRAVALGPGGEITAVGFADDGFAVSGLVARVIGSEAVTTGETPQPPPFALRSAPNPARASGAVILDVAAPGPVRLALYDLLGREVALLHDGPLTSGTHALPLPIGVLAPGVYVARADGAGRSASLRVVVARG